MTLESTIVALAIHAGHIKYLLPRQPRSPRTRRLRPLPDTFVDVLPATCNSLAMIVLNQSQRRVPELNQRPAVHLVQFRSEEHTSELQSQSNLVCRLLLEKKKE